MKKTLLIAAAALAASIISSEAQVYSQNVVGYANVGYPTGGKNYLVTCQFAVGVSNGLNEVFGSSLPAFSSVLIYNTSLADYASYVYDPTDPNGVGPGAPVWYLADDTTPAVPIPTVPPGMGFFVIPSAAATNTFTGSVAVNVGSSNVMTLPIGGKNYLVASVIPYAGAITNGSASGGGMNLNSLPAFSSILVYNTAISDYTSIVYDPTDPNGVGPGAPLFYQSDDTTPYVDPSTGGNSPSVKVGQGFFIVPSAAMKWTNGLSSN